MPISGSAPSKSFTRAIGAYTGSDAWSQLDQAGVPIRAVDQDTRDEDFAAGINGCLFKDGGNFASDMDINGNKFTNVEDGTARNHFAAIGQIQDGELIHATDSGTNTRTATLSPAVTAYVSGMMVALKAASANTGSATINLNSVGAGTVKKGKTGASNLDAGDIGAGKMGVYIHDGTNWQMLNAPEFPSGTVMLFNQTSAPTGWTKNTSTGDDSALRLTTGTVSSGGSVAFTTAFVNNRTVSGTVAGTTLTENQIPSHRHFTVDNAAGTDATDPSSTNQISYRNTSSPGGSSGNNYYLTGTANDADVGRTSATGGGASHDHSWSGTVNIAIAYVDIIRATKD